MFLKILVWTKVLTILTRIVLLVFRIYLLETRYFPGMKIPWFFFLIRILGKNIILTKILSKNNILTIPTRITILVSSNF